jgi:hypothetical protein
MQEGEKEMRSVNRSLNCRSAVFRHPDITTFITGSQFVLAARNVATIPARSAGT